MASLNAAEERTILALKDLALTCKKYEENFSDIKLKTVKDEFIEPVIMRMGNGLLEAFEELKPIVADLKEKGIISES